MWSQQFEHQPCAFLVVPTLTSRALCGSLWGFFVGFSVSLAFAASKWKKKKKKKAAEVKGMQKAQGSLLLCLRKELKKSVCPEAEFVL